MSDLLYSVRGLQTHFYDPDLRSLAPALRGLDLEIYAGECLGVTGESGGGKSTLARALIGLVRGKPGVSGGTFELDGQRILKDFPHTTFPLEQHWRRFLFRHWQSVYQRRLRLLRGSDIFFIAQDPRSALNPYLTIGRQLRECGERPVAELLEQVCLPSQTADRYPHELSTGMCQRVLVSMALALPCRIVLADEPVAKLDLRLRRRVIDLLAQIPQSGRALVLFTHQIDLIRHLADRVAVLFRGSIVEQGDARVVLAPDGPHHPYTRHLSGAYAGIDALIAPGALTAETAGGCVYRQRCRLAQIDRCSSELPPLASLGTRSEGRCWVETDTPS